MKIYRLSGGKYVLPVEIDTDRGGTITSPLLPDFALPIADAKDLSPPTAANPRALGGRGGAG